ncbi:unnamed protein product [Rhizophagus irregularis]|nr:unnamed protein product [Rhizophagus irregularis]
MVLNSVFQGPAAAWTKIKETIFVLEPIEKATKSLSGSIKDDFDQYQLADSIKQKIEEYWIILDDATTIASILDPRIKTSLFELVSLYKENSTSSREYFQQLKKRRLGATVNTEQISVNSDFAEIK